MKWNDIRRVGPLLIMALVAVVMTNPSFVGATNSVGSPSPVGCEGLVSGGVDLTDESPVCCIENSLVTGVMLDPCSPESPPAVETPAATDDEAADEPEAETPPVFVKPPPPSPDPIMGPIWLGAIQVDVLAPGLVELDVPDLLAAFIERNVVKIYDADGVMVYEGGLPANGKLLVFSSNAPMTVKTTLTTLAPYTEIIAPVGTAS